MNMLMVAGIAVLAGLVFLVKQWLDGRGSAHFVLGIQPLALLLIALPSPGEQVRLTKTFQAIAVAGQGGLGALMPMCRRVLYIQLVGWVCLLLVLLVAAATQGVAMRIQRDVAENPDGSEPGAGQGHSILPAALACVAAMSLPVAWLAWLSRSTVEFVVKIGVALTPPAQAPAALEALGFSEIEQVSELIARRLVLTTVGGAALVPVLVIAGIAGVVLARRRQVAHWLVWFSWVTCGALMAWGATQAVQLVWDLKWFQQLPG